MSRSWKIISVFALLMSAVVPACLSVAQDEQGDIDWPMFQYNMQRTGACDYPAIEQPEIAWSTRVGIMGYLNNPAIDGNRVFVGSSGSEHNTPDDLDGIYCLDLNTGEILWHRPTDTDACGVAISETLVFAGDDSGLFQAIDRDSGEVAWTYEFSESVFAQPLLSDNQVVVGDAEGRTSGFDQETGEMWWQVQGGGAIRGGVSGDDDFLYVAFLDGEVWCLNQEGDIEWETLVPDFHRASQDIYPAPTIADGRIVYAFARGTYGDVPALGCLRSDGEVEWHNQESGFRDAEGNNFGNIRSSPAIYEEWLIYGEPYGNELTFVDRTDGTYFESIELGAPMFPHWPSPVIAGSALYLGRHDGGLYAVDLETREKAWMLYLGDHPLAGQSSLPDDILPDDTYGTEWEPNVGKPLYATPAIARDGTIVTGSGDGWLYCIRERE